MLKVNDLESQIKSSLTDIYKPAIKQIFSMLFVQKSDFTDELINDIADTFDDMTSAPMAEMLAAAIDTYIKNISISGTIITTGSPFTQQAQIIPSPTPITAGKIPNTLGIS